MICSVRQAVSAAIVMLYSHSVGAQDCPVPAFDLEYATPSITDGWSFRVIANGFTYPRGIIQDTKGNLLVVDRGAGIQHLNLEDHNGNCVEVAQKTTLIDDTELNHGIQLSEDGLMLYASSAEAVYRWTYDPDTISVSNRQTLINNMTNDGHYTRTLLLSRKEPEMLVVSRGSAANIDQLSAYKNNGISQIRALNLSELSTNDDEETGGIEPFNHATSGRLLGWGLRNSVGMAEHPITGGIYSVENSADGIERGGINIKNDNPGEELNFHGYLSDPTSGNQGGHFGYPFCLALWDTTISASNNFTDLGDMQTGDQFAHDRGFQWLDPDSRPGTEATTESADPDLLDGDVDDARCARDFVPPRLTFKAHMAPLDIKFSPDGTLAYVTWHGSWNRVDPAGYKVSVFEFDAETGEPVAQPRDTENVLQDLIWNPNTVQDCPRNCFRPVGLAVDEAYAARGGKRVFFTSDSTGEI